MTKAQQSRQIDEKIYEAIGAIANLAAVNDGKKITLSELAQILTIANTENIQGADYQLTHDLIRKAYQYFLDKGDTQTAENIKNTYTKKDGTPVVA